MTAPVQHVVCPWHDIRIDFNNRVTGGCPACANEFAEKLGIDPRGPNTVEQSWWLKGVDYGWRNPPAVAPTPTEGPETYVCTRCGEEVDADDTSICPPTDAKWPGAQHAAPRPATAAAPTEAPAAWECPVMGCGRVDPHVHDMPPNGLPLRAARSPGTPEEPAEPMERLIEASSFGTSEAKALRAQAPPEVVADLVAKATGPRCGAHCVDALDAVCSLHVGHRGSHWGVLPFGAEIQWAGVPICSCGHTRGAHHNKEAECTNPGCPCRVWDNPPALSADTPEGEAP